jgi:hypothetical protein
MYPIFEDVVQKVVFELLENDPDEPLLARLFLFFEDMANSTDLNISRDLLEIAIITPLVYRRESLRRAWKFLGPKKERIGDGRKKKSTKPVAELAYRKEKNVRGRGVSLGARPSRSPGLEVFCRRMRPRHAERDEGALH